MDKFQIKNSALDLFFPAFCFGCQKEGVFLCQDCKETLDISDFNYCLCSKNPIRILTGSTNNPQGKCSRCSAKNLHGLFSALPYKEKTLTKKLIHNFKYEPYVKGLAKPLAEILIEHLIRTGKNTDQIWENGILVPVPLDKKKLKNRGYNQSEELAKELSEIIKIPVLTDILIKIKQTKPQMELSKEEREKNLKGAFAVKPAFASELRRGKVFLVDDVYTTGSTMEECAKILKQSGAETVWGITVAREG